MPNWTLDQERAINERGGKIIVSAAAGSGKTAVLSQRVIKYILSGGSVRKLLVVTFTNAAALEMKTRIKKKIKEAYNNDENNNHLKKELSLVDSSDIMTMDSFYGNLVKNNFEKLGIDKNFDILSNEDETILKNKILKEVLRDSFDSVEGYESMLDFFGARDTSLISNIIIKINYFLNTMPFKDKVIKNIISKYEGNYYKDLLLNELKSELKSYKSLYEELIENLYNEGESFDKSLTIAKADLNIINDIINTKSLDELSSRLRSMDFLRFYTPKNCVDNPVIIKNRIIRKDVQDLLKKKIIDLHSMSDELYDADISLCKKNIKVLFDVVDIFESRLLDEKKKINAYSFSDVAYFVIDLLIKDGNKTDLAKKLSSKYDEILIDEYQDTNYLQNIIFNAISKDNTNLFIVGDVKQSIYKFRSAAPEIFNSDKKGAYKDKFPKLITLSKNFRSRKEILDFSNFVFENTMSEDFGEIDYNEDEMLYLGASYEDSNNLDTEVILIDTKEKDDDDDTINAEKEAIVVAEKVKTLLDSNYKVYDKDKEEFRKIKESDIALLFRSSSYIPYYIKALNNRGISAYSTDNKAYFDNYEVKLIINMLKVIDNPYDDVALLSVISSNMVDISLDDVVDVRYNDKYNSLYNNLLNSNNVNIINFLNTLKDLKEYSYNHTLYELLNKVYKDFDILSIILADKQGINKEKNIIQMVNHAVNYENTKKRSLHEFISYLENINENKESLEGINPLSNGDNVLITTIHKSKGLEYPVVFLCETGRQFNMKDLKEDIMLNNDYGFVFSLRDNKYNIKYDSIPKMAFKMLEKNKILSEELRVLYVALTRAKEKIIITGLSKNIEALVNKASSKMGNEKLISNSYLKNVNCYLDILIPCLLRHPSSKILRELSTIDCKTFVNEAKISINLIEGKEINESEFNIKSNEKSYFDIDWYNKICSTKYEEEIPEYLSVSMIKQKNMYNKMPNFMSDGISHTKLGTLYHKIFEFLPVIKYSISNLEEQLNNLVSNNIITTEERKMVDIEKIFAYLTSDLYNLMIGNKVYKEKEITFLVPSYYYDNEKKNGMILTSGIIDLLFIKDDVYYIVDYKTDKVDNLNELVDRYKMQLDLYEIGIKDIYNAKKVEKYIYSIYLNKFIKVE